MARGRRQRPIDVVGFDLGTSFGWSHLRVANGEVERIDSGVWNLSVGKHANKASRLMKCKSSVSGLLDRISPDAVAYEAVARHRGVDAAHLYGAFHAIVTMACETSELPCQGYFPATLKKAATGSGKLTKGMSKASVMDAMWMRFGIRRKKRDDEADAIAAALAMIQDMGWAGE